MMLCPRLPEKVAIAMLKEHGDLGTIIDLVRAGDSLTLAKGFGKIMNENLKESIT